MISRRNFGLLSSAATAAMMLPLTAEAWLRRGSYTAPPVQAGWGTLALGGGGYLNGIDIADDGTKYGKTDTYGMYWFNPATQKWVQRLTPAAFGAVLQPDGCSEIRCSPTNPNEVYCIYGQGGGTNVFKLYRSTDYGAHWTVCTRPGGGDFQLANNTPNEYPYGRANSMIAVDPNNHDVIYVGTSANSFPTNGLYRSIDRGITWTLVTDVAPAAARPGIAGIVFDRYGGTTVVGGQTRTSRIILGSYNTGTFETLDGGQTWTEIASAATAPLTMPAITTSQANCVLVFFNDDAPITSVTSSPPLTWAARVNNYDQGFGAKRSLWYAVAPAAGTYTVIANYADGGSNSNALLFSVKGADTTSAATIWDGGGPVTSNIAEPSYSSITTVGASSMIFCFIRGTVGKTQVDTGWTSIFFTGGIFAEMLTAGPGTYTPKGFNDPPPADPWTSYWGNVIDAIKNGVLDGSAVHATGGGLLTPGPVRIYSAQMDAAGTYWANDDIKNIWRRWWNGSAWVWQKMDGSVGTSNTLPLNYFNPVGLVGPSGFVCVDPRPGFEGRVTVSGPAQGLWGYQTFNGNAAQNVVSWVGSGGSPSFNPSHTTGNPLNPNGDVTWQVNNLPFPACGEMRIDPTDGSFWMAEGNGVIKYPAIGQTHALNYDANNYQVWPIVVTAGIENMVGEDVCCPVRPNNDILLALADRNLMRKTSPTAYPPGTLGGTQHNCRQLDWASSNPAFMHATIPDGVVGNPDQSGWSGDYGVTWNEYATKAAHNGGGSSIAASTADNVIIVHSDFTRPSYTLDRGASWAKCTGLPDGFYVAQPYYHERPLVADRRLANVFYVYVKASVSPANPGVYRSTDGGVNFAKMGAGFSFVNDSQFAFQMRTTLCQSQSGGNFSDIWFCANLGDGIWVSRDQGATRKRLIETSDTSVMGIGKARPGGTGYDTIFFVGKKGGVSGYWMLSDFAGFDGSNNTIGTWTNLTPNGISVDLPDNCAMDFVQVIDGDYNIYGRLYALMNGSGGAYYELGS